MALLNLNVKSPPVYLDISVSLKKKKMQRREFVLARAIGLSYQGESCKIASRPVIKMIVASVHTSVM